MTDRRKTSGAYIFITSINKYFVQRIHRPTGARPVVAIVANVTMLAASHGPPGQARR
jgi:hypothetical protein